MKILLKKGHRYLVKEKSYSTTPPIYEFFILEIGKTAVKVEDKIHKTIHWVAKEKFVKNEYEDGYYIQEDLGKLNARKNVSGIKEVRPKKENKN